MKKVVSVFFCIVVFFGLFAFSAGASAPILCPRCGSSAKLVGSREEGMYIVYKYRCTNSACGHTFESKFLAGGGSTRGGGAGRRDPLPGYSSDGVANYNIDGFLIWQPSWPSDYTKYTYLSTPTYYSITSSSFTKEVALVTHSASGNHLSVLLTPLSGQSSFPFSDIVFKGMSFTAPVSGYYTSQSVRVNAVGRSSEPRSYSKSNNWRYKAVYFNAGDSVYCGDSSTTSVFSVGAWNIFERCTYLKADIYTPIFTIEPLDSMVTKQTNITINNNTFTGNIYQDTKNNLTYIYPQYSSVDDSGNTITKIFENPIIYNSTTNQYYTYDSTTNNYYYITYVTATPEPTASPEPSATPDPGATPTPTPEPGSGSGWNPFKWLTDLLKDIVESILKGLWKLLTSIFGFILWLLSLLFKLFPWLPNSGILALCAGVVVVTVIRIIKFITGR